MKSQGNTIIETLCEIDFLLEEFFMVNN